MKEKPPGLPGGRVTGVIPRQPIGLNPESRDDLTERFRVRANPRPGMTTSYSPLPNRRDHHPARRGWVSVVVSEAGWVAGAEGAAGSGWLGVAGGGASPGGSTPERPLFSPGGHRPAALFCPFCASPPRLDWGRPRPPPIAPCLSRGWAAN